MFKESILSFRKLCFHTIKLPEGLQAKLGKIISKEANTTDLFPFFLNHAYELYPHLKCMDELKIQSNLAEPAYWYLDTREMKRKIIYHAGPTNSGKTYSALLGFQKSESGVYCGPLKLLANEVYIKTNQAETACDLVTGEERKFANETGQPANHVACTVEMCNLEREYEVAVIDEIQMIKDGQRGWAWTRAFLGVRAKEIHVCGDMSAVGLITELTMITGDEIEVRNYQRLTPLTVEDHELGTFDKLLPGDCIVCFNKNDIYQTVSLLEKKGHEVAVVYGSMPPGVKLAQAARFNDPNDKCKLLVATDAIGMGLNLNIRRVIFYSLQKPQLQEKKEGEVTSAGVELGYITTSQALQIAGRAGRFKTQFPDGYVTTLKKSDLPILRHILKQPLERIKKAGLLPTEEQIELFAHNLPNQSLGALIEIFMSICKIESSDYFLCEFENVKALAVLIDHIPMQLKTKYKFCLSPINVNETLITSCFVKFARYYSNNEPVTAEALKKFIGYPLQTPRKIDEVRHLEVVYDVFDLYLWLSTRYVDMFPYAKEVTQMRKELEDMIYTGVKDLSKLNSGGMKPANRNIPHRNDPSPLNNSSESRHGRGSTTDEPSRGKSANSKNKSVVEGQQSRE